MLRKLLVALFFVVLAGAGLASIYGLVEVKIIGREWARFLPVVVATYGLSGSLAGLVAWLAIVALAVFPRSRHFLFARLAPAVLGATLAAPWVMIGVLELTFEHLPHGMSIAAILLAGVGFALIVVAAAVVGRVVPKKLAVAILGIAAALVPLFCLVLLVSRPGWDVVERPSPKDLRNSGGRSPNVVIVLIDTLRADHLSCYGYERETSPFIDRIAEENVRFTNAYAQAPWTMPSVSSLFTSRFVSSLSLTGNVGRLPADMPTFAEVFRDAGYETAAFIANPVLVNGGYRRGFRVFFSGLLDFLSLDLYRYWLWLGLNEVPWISHRSDYLNTKVFEWLDEREPSESERPFLLYVHYMDPHEPYSALPRYRQEFRTEAVALVKGIPHPKPSFLPFDALSPDKIDERTRRGRIDAYDGTIRQVDEAVRELVTRLDLQGVWKNTVFVLVSDHGEEFADHGGWGHGQSLFNELIRVPLILRAPGAPWRGRVIESNVMLVDLYPTLVDLAGLVLTDENHGRSLLPVLKEESDSSDIGAEVAFSELFQKWGAQRALVDGEWKRIFAVAKRDQRGMLFNLAEDAAERNDLVVECQDGLAPEDHAMSQQDDPCAVAARLDSTTEQVLGDLEFPVAGASDELEEGLRRQLQALGYIQ